MQQGQYHKEGVRQYIYLPVCNYENNYSNQLLQFHSVPGLMSYEIRTLNNKNYIYYKLKYKTSLKAVGDYIRLQETTVLNMIDSIANIIQNTKDYPMPIIMDGVINNEVLKDMKKNTNWVIKILKDRNLKLQDIFYAFHTKEKTFIIKKSDLL